MGRGEGEGAGLEKGKEEKEGSRRQGGSFKPPRVAELPKYKSDRRVHEEYC